MSSFLPSSAFSGFVPNDLIIPEEFERANQILTDYFRTLIDALNDKDIGQYNTTEIVTGQQFFTPSDTSKYRFTLRKVIDFGSLPASAPKSVAHGITTTDTTVFTRIYGTATNPGATTLTTAIPLPYMDPNTLANGIELSVGPTQVTITTAADYSAFTTTYVILEYIQSWS